MCARLELRGFSSGSQPRPRTVLSYLPNRSLVAVEKLRPNGPQVVMLRYFQVFDSLFRKESSLTELVNRGKNAT